MNKPKVVNDELTLHKKFCATAARELGYSENVIEAIECAKTVAKIDQIMVSARHEKWSE